MGVLSFLRSHRSHAWAPQANSADSMTFAVTPPQVLHPQMRARRGSRWRRPSRFLLPPIQQLRPQPLSAFIRVRSLFLCRPFQRRTSPSPDPRVVSRAPLGSWRASPRSPEVLCPQGRMPTAARPPLGRSATCLWAAHGGLLVLPPRVSPRGSRSVLPCAFVVPPPISRPARGVSSALPPLPPLASDEIWLRSPLRTADSSSRSPR
jgi:hypothetical protein